MIAPEGQPILTAAQMRAAEDAAVASGTSVETLMQRAGEGIAAAVRRLTAGADVLVICGPGNNGGDGYVAASVLHRHGLTVRVVADEDPRTPAARAARRDWQGDVEPLSTARPAPVLIDCMFGTGLSRPLPAASDVSLARLAHAAQVVIAADLPSGVDADTGAVPDWIAAHPATLTLALGALKPAHVLEPAASACGTVRLIDLGLGERPTDCVVATAPHLPQPGPESHKYTRGMVAVVVGAMEGAARLAGIAALRSGAGYVALYGDSGRGGPDALVHRPYDPEALSDPRIGAILIGPGLGRDDDARQRLKRLVCADDHALVIDGDALQLLDPDTLASRRHPVILTPHAGEFKALFGDGAD
jgi:ADP-dependent NAD(P)H-hydrate dehydratase / NAD(P)H-hydrate epimerase